MMPAPTVHDVDINAQIACVEREISMRRTVYARRVDERKMRQSVADRQILEMQAVLHTLERVKSAGVRR